MIKIECSRWDLNPHESPHMPLKHACLPIPPRLLVWVLAYHQKPNHMFPVYFCSGAATGAGAAAGAGAAVSEGVAGAAGGAALVAAGVVASSFS